MEKVAVILAGGKGTRLRPYTIVLPKPLVPINDFPVLELILRQLKANGFSRIVIAVNHLAELIMAYFGDGSRWGLNIEYSIESIPLGTIGPLKIIKNLPANVLLMNGDVITDLSISSFYEDHVNQNRLFTIAGYKRTLSSEYGVLEIDGAEFLAAFREKPTYELLVSMGVYMINTSIIANIPDQENYGFDHLMRDLLAQGKHVKVDVHKGFWLDIGRPEDFEKAQTQTELINRVYFS